MAEVRLFAGANPLGTFTPQGNGEYVFNLDPNVLPPGDVTFRAVAMDRAGNLGEISFRVDRTPPTVVWKRPAEGLQVFGTVTLEVEATDNPGGSGVAKVEFFAGSMKVGEDTSAPYAVSWDTTEYPDGLMVLKARAVDVAGNASEATLTVTVANQDKVPPTVVWKRPAEGLQVFGTVTLEVEATDNPGGSGVAKVEFFAGSMKVGEDTSAPYAVSWDTTEYPDGLRVLKVRAVDVAGNASETEITVNISNGPQVAWQNPVPNQRIAGFISLEAKVRAVRAVDRVEFYFGPDETNMDRIPGSPTPSPDSVYSLDWNILRVEPGVYLLKAVAVDAGGFKDETTISVEISSPFVITTPSNGDLVGPWVGRTIVAITVGVIGTLPPGVTVSRVEILINGCSVADARWERASDDSYVYVYPWDTAQTLSCRSDSSQIAHDPTKSGDRVITARVYYTGGDTFTGGVLVTYSP
ncbi:Ig-like domain-containing protein [Thermus scotoductus]|uniref:Ig-like domain-containing protein n=1 Tax=Thermus scotoductus TaxID=37636 RepID=UPI001F1F2420|nr:Ig-like domain-containing protein [Thermus scotoductus]